MSALPPFYRCVASVRYLPFRQTNCYRLGHVKLLPQSSVTNAYRRTFSHGERELSQKDGYSSTTSTNKNDGKNESYSTGTDKGPHTFSETSFPFQENGEYNWSGSQEDFGDDEEKDYENSVKQRILGAALQHVHEFGWTNEALEAGAKSEGLPPTAQGMFPRGGGEIAEYFYTQCNADLVQHLKQEVERLEAENEGKIKTRPFIRNAVETRLRMILPYKDIWKQAMAIQTLPQNTVNSWKNLMNLSDEIWHYAGDQSVDFNWYTKRFTLAAVYKATEIYMLQDKSVDQSATWEFLDRRLEDVQKLGSANKQLNQSGSVLREGLSGFFTMGRNMLGMNSRNR